MKLTFDAIVDGGMLRPLLPQPLHERDRVRVTVEQAQSAAPGTNGSGKHSDAARNRATEAMLDAFRESPLRFGGKLPSRDEIHER